MVVFTSVWEGAALSKSLPPCGMRQHCGSLYLSVGGASTVVVFTSVWEAAALW